MRIVFYFVCGILLQLMFGCKAQEKNTEVVQCYLLFPNSKTYLIEVNGNRQVKTTSGEPVDFLYGQLNNDEKVANLNLSIFSCINKQEMSFLDDDSYQELSEQLDRFLKKHQDSHNSYKYVWADDSWGVVIKVGNNHRVFDSSDVDVEFRYLLYKILRLSPVEIVETEDWTDYYEEWINNNKDNVQSYENDIIPIDSLVYSEKNAKIDTLLTRYFYDNIGGAVRDGVFSCDAYMVVNSSGKVVDATILYIHNELSYDAIELERMGNLLREVKFIMPQDVKQDSLYVCYVSLNSE